MPAASRPLVSVPRFLAELSQRFPTRHDDDLLVVGLAELLRRDRVALRLLLDALDLPDAPEDLGERFIFSQVRLPGPGGTRVDLRIQVGTGEEAWVAHVAALTGTAVADRVVDRLLGWQATDQPAHAAALVPRSRLPTVLAAVETLIGERGSLGSSPPRVAAWEELIEALRQDAARMDEASVPPLRLDVVDLATRLGLGGLRAVSPTELRQARRAAVRLGGAERSVRRCVRALLPVGQVRPVSAEEAEALDEPRQAAWLPGPPMAVAWAAERSVARDLPLKGLGLQAMRGVGAGRPVLRWWLRARPRKRHWKALDHDLRDLGWFREDGGWWAVELVDVGDPTEHLADQLQRVLRQARQTLAEDLELTAADHPVDLADEPGPTLGTIATSLERLGTTARALSGWRDELRRAVIEGLRAQLGHDAVRSPRDTARRHWLALPDGREVLLETRWALDERPSVRLRLAPGDLDNLQPAIHLLGDVAWPPGVDLSPDGTALVWDVDPGAVPVAQAVPDLAQTFVLAWTRGMDQAGTSR